MIQKQGTWGEIDLGSYIQSKDGTLWKVTGTQPDAIFIVNAQGQSHTMPRQPPATPITMFELTSAERSQLLSSILGATELVVLDEREGQAIRAQKRRLDPLRSKGAGALARARMHLEHTHGIYIDDQAVANSLPKLIEAHDAHHDDHTHLMVFPHHHAEKEK